MTSVDQVDAFIEVLPASAPSMVGPSGFRGKPLLMHYDDCGEPLGIIDMGYVNDVQSVADEIAARHVDTTCKAVHTGPGHGENMTTCNDCGEPMGVLCARLLTDEARGEMREHHKASHCPTSAVGRA